jgi:ABC-2 type transport system ATP-binding protein
MNALEIKNVSKSFSGFCLDNISLTLPSGCIMGLIGENGAGKSTTIKLILDMLHKDSGTITILGKDNGEDIALTKEDVGVVMDEVGMPECLTAKQIGNVMKHTFRNWNEDEYARLLQKLSLPDNKQFKDFSRGMKMKLGIAVAMSHGAKLLLLDEPTSGLDPFSRDELLHIFTALSEQGVAVFFSTHITSDLEKCADDIIYISRGEMIAAMPKNRFISENAQEGESLEDAILRMERGVKNA